LTPNTPYYARVRAKDNEGNISSPSAVASARPLSPTEGTVASVRAFPSPFRPGRGAAGITFDQLPAQTTLQLYTTSGLLVKTLAADSYGQALWDVTNNDGSSVSSGVYLAVIEKGGERRVMKVMVVK
jgi:flagellar hook assembly protein FlgD